MNIDKLRSDVLPSAVRRALEHIDKEAAAAAKNTAPTSDDVVAMVKEAHQLGLEQGFTQGYETGASDATVSVIQKLAMEDAFEDGPTAAAYHQGRMSDHAAEAREGAEELAAAVNQGDDQITAGSSDTPAGTVGTGAGGGDGGEEGEDGDVEKEASAYLEALFAKQGMDGDGDGDGGPMEPDPGEEGDGEHDASVVVGGDAPGSDEYGAKTVDLQYPVRPSHASYAQFARDMIQGTLNAG